MYSLNENLVWKSDKKTKKEKTKTRETVLAAS